MASPIIDIDAMREQLVEIAAHLDLNPMESVLTGKVELIALQERLAQLHLRLVP